MEPDLVWRFLSGVLQGLWEVKWALAAVAVLWLMASAVRLLPRRYRKPKGPGANVIAQADWREFERLTAIALRQEGYAVRENPADLARADGGSTWSRGGAASGIWSNASICARPSA